MTTYLTQRTFYELLLLEINTQYRTEDPREEDLRHNRCQSIEPSDEFRLQVVDETRVDT